MNSFFIKTNGKYQRILFCEIHYVEAFKNYVRVYASKKNFLLHLTLKQLEEHLPVEQFFRIHKSYIAAIDKITQFDHESVCIDTMQLPLSPIHFESLKSRLNIVCTEKRNNNNVNSAGYSKPHSK